MSRPRTSLGDSHNFGRRVHQRGGRVVKPRTLFWERLLLDRGSSIRRFLDSAAGPVLGPDAFGFLPALRFFPSRSRDGGGEVQRLQLSALPSLSREDRLALARIAGRSLALWSWLGVSDLHWENLALGVDGRGHVVFTPLDIELILADLSLPTQTKLLPDADPEYAARSRHACGLRRLLPYLGKPIDAAALLTMAAAYGRTLAFLEDRGRQLAALLARLPGLRDAPIRVCLRGTDDYVRARSQPIWPPLLGAEVEQLGRGDIPYFFRLYGRPGIHYYGEPSLQKRERLPMRGDVPRLDPLLALSRGLRSPSRRMLREEGLFTVLGAFDHAGLAGVHRESGLEARFGARFLDVKLPSGEELRAPRDLSAFVGSLYLPCRCGETRSVFVPSVTVCDV